VSARDYHRAWRAARKEADNERPRLSPARLRSFASPLAWEQILALEPRRPASWWRDALIAADKYGSGWLVWNRERRAWQLTDRGRAVASMHLA
jgi:hypothetical protein